MYTQHEHWKFGTSYGERLVFMAHDSGQCTSMYACELTHGMHYGAYLQSSFDNFWMRDTFIHDIHWKDYISSNFFSIIAQLLLNSQLQSSFIGVY